MLNWKIRLALLSTTLTTLAMLSGTVVFGGGFHW